MPALASEGERAEALRSFTEGIYAPTTAKASLHKLNTVTTALAKFGLALLPPDTEKVAALGAVLKAGGYRSAEAYFTTYRGHLERCGYTLDGPLTRAFRDALRSCQRGRGGAVRARALPLDQLGSLPGGIAPWCPGGPIHARNSIVAGAWFLTREVELSTSRAALIEVSGKGTASPTVTWHLPASKSDPTAIGTSRTHGCSCAGRPTAACPVHAIWDQLLVLQKTFPLRWSREKGFDWDLPLFPDARGRAVEKEAMSDSIRAAAVFLGVPLSSPDLAEQVTGHSLRATGAQGLARAGVDEWAIQLLGRWGSKAIRSYTRQAALDRSATWARQAVANPRGDQLEALQLDESKMRALIARLVQEALPTFSPGLRASQAAAIKQDVLRELRAHRSEGTPSAASSSTAPPAARYVRNTATGVTHWASGALEGSLSSWTTTCGWRFAKSNATFAASSKPPLVHKLICEKCLPDARRSRMIELLQGMGRQGGGQ